MSRRWATSGVSSPSNPGRGRGPPMASMADTATRFFEACETGKGWDGCSQYCTEDATFAAQAEPLAGIDDLRGYTEWMKDLLALMPDGSYDLKALATDDERDCVVAY